MEETARSASRRPLPHPLFPRRPLTLRPPRAADRMTRRGLIPAMLKADREVEEARWKPKKRLPALGLQKAKKIVYWG